MSGVAIAAVAVLGADRMILGTGMSGPTESHAAIEPQDPNKLIETKLNQFDTALAPYENHVAMTLASMADNRQTDLNTIRDLFHPSEGWVTPASNQDSKSPVKTGDPVSAFSSNHTLMGLIAVDGVVYAVIDNDLLLQVGDQLDGFTMTSYNDRSAIFESKGKIITLGIKTDI